MLLFWARAQRLGARARAAWVQPAELVQAVEVVLAPGIVALWGPVAAQEAQTPAWGSGGAEGIAGGANDGIPGTGGAPAGTGGGVVPGIGATAGFREISNIRVYSPGPEG